MRSVHVGVILVAMTAAVGGFAGACGGGNSAGQGPNTPSATGAPSATTLSDTNANAASTDSGATAPSATASAPPPPPQLPDSYASASAPFSAMFDKYVALLKDEKQSCDKVAAAILKFARDKDNVKTRDTFYAERQKLTDAQRAVADQTFKPEDVQTKVQGAGPLMDKCKVNKKFQDALGGSIVILIPQLATPPNPPSSK